MSPGELETEVQGPIAGWREMEGREAQVVGEGEALVLTGGVGYTARWVKPAANAPTQYFDAAGAPIRLTPGRTWVELAEPGTTGILP